MTQVYSNPKRENDPYSLPDVEVFYLDAAKAADESYDPYNPPVSGFYYWACFPGCLPRGDPIGPFDTEADAIADAQAEAWQFED